ncbi:hypothetical protein ZIOFF_052824 [Zingiber officinale]|uniref:Nucleoporin autopeptidase n=1 Tax=Zingiber officinale TaxID=94328 RepID=A0A8J5FP78_ZINOF|nr:hypothetical protein ZIOFF_052824 [Zingiber officinale]
MFGSSNTFSQSSTSPFGSQPMFGQTSSTATNPFAPKLFGSPNSFGTQNGSSIFGGTSTGVFGQPSTPAFGASPAPAFGSSMPAFGASSTPAFSSGSSSFGGSSLFGQKPAFGTFGSSPNQSSPFGSTFQPTQPAFGTSLFGSTTPFSQSSQSAFGATTTPTFGSTSTPSFGTATTPAFGATTTPAFGATSTPAFGSTTTPAFGSTTSSLFGSAGTSFGVSSSPAFGTTAAPSFGTQTTSVFGSSSTPAFGASSAPTFGSPTVSAFGTSNTPFSFSSTPAFGQSTSAFGSAQATTPSLGSPGFGQSAFGTQPGGTRVASYSPTPEADGGTSSQPAGKLESISAMSVYKEKSHEELRWEDYQRGDKGGSNQSGQPAGAINFSAPSQPSPYVSTGTAVQSAANPFSSTTPANPFALKSPSFGSSGFGSTSTSLFNSPFSASSSSPFGPTSTTSLFGASSSSTFGSSSSPSLFGGSSAPAFGSSTSVFGNSLAGSSLAFGSGLGSTQASGLFQSSPAPFGQTSTPFAQPTSGTTTAFGSNLFSTPSTGFGGSLFSSSTPSLFPSSTPAGFNATPAAQTPFQSAPAVQPSNAFSFSNFGQIQPASSSGFGAMPNLFNQSTIGQPYEPPFKFIKSAAGQSNVVTQPVPVANPFGMLPAMPHMSIGRVGSTPSIQYGISSMPVVDKPIPARNSLLLVPRISSQRRIRLPPRKYSPKTDGPKLPFFADDETLSTPKADALFIPRENPRALVIRPVEEWPPRSIMEKGSIVKDRPNSANENGKVPGEPSAPAYKELDEGDNDEPVTEHGHSKDPTGQTASPSKPMHKANGGINGDHMQKAADSYMKISGHRAGKAAITYEHGPGIEALMPKLRRDDYYTIPRIQELAAKERAEPGFCRHVKDFVVGRHGYGSIKFYGETDVRALDLELIVQFNHREVIVYSDDDKKPPVGQGLNKPAEVTLLDIKCIDKKTGEQLTEGPRVERYKEMLTRKVEEQGAEFIAYDPVKAEWKFKVKHFSRYRFLDVDLIP